jgi:hypothetical protein
LTQDDRGHYQWDPTKGFSLTLSRTPEILFTFYSGDANWYYKSWYIPSYPTGDPSLIFGKWTQLVITTDNSLNLDATKLYVNGSEVTVFPQAETIEDYLIDDVGFLQFGGSPENGEPHLATPVDLGPHYGASVGVFQTRPLLGELDNLVIFNETLSAADVADLYAHPYSPWGLTAKPPVP